jgi:predicted GNAT family N-acyltransferase
MATAERQRGRGVGAAVLRAAIDTVHEQGGRLLWCNARESAVGFYARNGFRPQGEGFVEHGIPHLRMWREIGPEGGT